MTLFAFLSAAVALSAGQASVGGNPKTDFVVAGDKAYGLILPVQVVADAEVRQALWSPDGNYILAIHNAPKPTTDQIIKILSGDRSSSPPEKTSSLLLWNKRTRRVAELWKVNGARNEIESIRWLPQSSVAIATIRQAVIDGEGSIVKEWTTFLEVSPGNATARILKEEKGFFGIDTRMEVSPTRPLVVFETLEFGIGGDFGRDRSTIQFYEPDKGFSEKVILPERCLMGSWVSGGDKVSIAVMSDYSAPGGSHSERWLLLDPRTGTLTPVAQMPESGFWQLTNPEGSPLILFPLVNYVRRKELVPTWLRAREGESRVLVSAECQFAQLSPKFDAVLYVTRGVAMVRPITELPKKAFEDALMEALRREAVNNAHLVGMALAFYAEDNGDAFPGGTSDWRSLIASYVMNRSILDGFNYTFGGGLLKNGQIPAETELGYFTGPGGRAVAYADGHAEWIPDK